MTEPKLSQLWHRAGPAAALGALLCATAFASTTGCGDGGTGGSGGSTSSTTTTTTTSTTTTTTSTTSTTTTTTTSTTTGAGGSGGDPGPLESSPAADVPSAFDATPDPDGIQLYFTAVDPDKGTGVFRAKADGSDAAYVEVHSGDPFVAPFGIAIGTDGKQLYVADPGASGTKDLGQIFVLPVGGGGPSPLAGTEDFVPRGLEIGQESGKDVLFFTGTDPTDGKPGVFKIGVGGGVATTVSKDARFRDPAGIAVAKSGDVYLVDTHAAATLNANVFKVASNGAVTEVIAELRVGYPPGVALTLDEKSLLVSTLDPATLNDVLVSYDFVAKTQTPIAGVAGMFSEAAGLHRAKNKNLFAWADSSAGPKGGKVLVVK